MLKFVFELEDMADYTADYLYYRMKDGKPVLTVLRGPAAADIR